MSFDLNSKHSSNCSLERGIGGKPGPLTSGCPPTKEWANSQLSFVISLLRGDDLVCSRSFRLTVARLVKARLRHLGFWWQASRVQNWIRRFLRGDFDERGWVGFF